MSSMGSWEQDYRKYTIPTDVLGKVFPTELCGKVFSTDLGRKSSPKGDFGKIRTLVASAGVVSLSSEPETFIYHFLKPVSSFLAV